jgi:hypothetical protein
MLRSVAVLAFVLAAIFAAHGARAQDICVGKGEVTHQFSNLIYNYVNPCGHALVVTVDVTTPQGQRETRTLHPSKCGGTASFRVWDNWQIVGEVARQEGREYVCGSNNQVERSGGMPAVQQGGQVPGTKSSASLGQCRKACASAAGANLGGAIASCMVRFSGTGRDACVDSWIESTGRPAHARCVAACEE